MFIKVYDDDIEQVYLGIYLNKLRGMKCYNNKYIFFNKFLLEVIYFVVGGVIQVVQRIIDSEFILGYLVIILEVILNWGFVF